MQEIAITPEEDTKENASAEVAQLKEKCEELRNSITTIEQQLERLQSQNTLLEQYSSGLFSAGRDATTSDLLDQATIGRRAIQGHRKQLMWVAHGRVNGWSKQLDYKKICSLHIGACM